MISLLKGSLSKPWHEYISFFSLRQVGTTPNGHVHGEQIYIHSKVLIVDDAVAFVGSANLNDRSMLGSRDSEVGIKITGAGAHAPAKLRMRLWLEHLGQLHPSTASTLSPTELQSLQEPASDQCWNLWRNIAEGNTSAFRDLLSTWSDSSLRTWSDFHQCIERIGGLPGEGRTWESVYKKLMESVRG